MDSLPDGKPNESLTPAEEDTSPADG